MRHHYIKKQSVSFGTRSYQKLCNDFMGKVQKHCTHGRPAEPPEKRSARVQAAPHFHIVVHTILLLFQFERQERQVHVHVGLGLDGPFACDVAIVVQVAVIGMRIKVFHRVGGDQPTAAN